MKNLSTSRLSIISPSLLSSGSKRGKRLPDVVMKKEKETREQELGRGDF